jgi:hypothetical protein
MIHANDIIIGPFKQTGDIKIDVDLVIKNWSNLWMLSEWRRNNTFRIVKFLRIDSPITVFKFTISKEQAYELIERLKLIEIASPIGSGYSWRRKIDE